MTQSPANPPSQSTWRNALAVRWAALCGRPLALRIVVALLYFVAAFAIAVTLTHAILALTAFGIALWHFWLGKPTADDSKLTFFKYVSENFTIAGAALPVAFVLACMAGFVWSVYRSDFRVRLWALLRRDIFLAHCMLIAAGIVLLGFYYSYRSFAEIESLRIHVCVAAIVAGVGSTICLGGAMHYLDLARLSAQPGEFFIRWPLSLYKRVILLAELATTALAILAAGALIFSLKLPAIPMP